MTHCSRPVAPYRIEFRFRRPRLHGGDHRLAMLAAGLLTLGGLLSAIELLVLGRLTAPVLALDAIGGTLLPYGLLMMCLRLTPTRFRRSAPDEDPGSWGWEDGHGENLLPWLPPPGGVKIDWKRFEADFGDYVESLTAGRPAAEPS